MTQYFVFEVSKWPDYTQDFEHLDYTFFLIRPVYKRQEPEICQNFKNKIRECPGWDLASAIFENNFIQVSYLENELNSKFSEI